MSEYGLTSTSTHYRSFRRRVFPVNHLLWYRQPNKDNQAKEHTNSIKITQPKKESLVNSTTYNHKKPRLRDRTVRAWFSRLIRHTARKRSGSIFTTKTFYRFFFQTWEEYSNVHVLGHLVLENTFLRIHVVSWQWHSSCLKDAGWCLPLLYKVDTEDHPFSLTMRDVDSNTQAYTHHSKKWVDRLEDQITQISIAP